MSVVAKRHGASLIEIILAVGIFVILAAGTLALVVLPLFASPAAAERARAMYLVEEGIEAARTIRDDHWTKLADGTFGVYRTSTYCGTAKWCFANATDSTTDTSIVYVRTVSVAAVSRASLPDGDIVASGGLTDIRTKKITSTVAWTSAYGGAKSAEAVTYLTDWNVYDWLQTTRADFNAGTHVNDSTTATLENGTGDIRLAIDGAQAWYPAGGRPLRHTTDVDFSASGSKLISTEIIGTGTAAEVRVVCNFNALLGFICTSPAYYFSPVIDGGATNLWNTLFWTEILPAGADANIATRTGSNANPPDATTCGCGQGGGWEACSSPLVTTPGGSEITGLNNNRYLQYCVEFTTPGGGVASVPRFTDIAVIRSRASGSNIENVDIVNATNTWAISSAVDGQMLYFDGKRWTEQASSTAVSFFGIDMLSTTDGQAVGQGGNIRRWNGTSWNSVTSPTATTLNDISFASASLGFAVGNGGEIIKWNGSSWADCVAPECPAGLPANNLNAVYCPTSTLCFAVGDRDAALPNATTILKWDGVAWARCALANATCKMPLAAITENLHGVHCQTNDLCFAVGNTGRIVKWTGGATLAWATDISPTVSQLNNVEFRSPTSAFAVGNAGTIISWNGATWSTQTSPTDRNLFGLSLTTSAAASCATPIACVDGWMSGELGTFLARTKPYLANGTFHSSRLDADANPPAWGTLFFNTDLPTDPQSVTQLALRLRSGSVVTPPATCAAGGNWSACGDEITTSGTAITSPLNRFLQYLALLRSSNFWLTPRLLDITGTYRR